MGATRCSRRWLIDPVHRIAMRNICMAV